MDEPGWIWPAWKFGFKRNDLFTTLKDQYNTFSCSIQDPEAFHHDVYEISNEAETAEDFHRLMASRRQQRLEELNHSLETAAVEIIANPDLIGTEKWKLAVQVFRTRSLDALVGYFSSFLPEPEAELEPLSSQPSSTVSSPRSSFSDISSQQTCGTKETDWSSDKLFFLEHPLAQLTHEPLSSDAFPVSCADSISINEGCPSLYDDRSETSESSPASNVDAMSYSGSEPEQIPDHLERSFLDDDEDLSQHDSLGHSCKPLSYFRDTNGMANHLPFDTSRHDALGSQQPLLPGIVAHNIHDETFAMNDDHETPTSQHDFDGPNLFAPILEAQSVCQTDILPTIAASPAGRLSSSDRAVTKQRHGKREARRSVEIRRSREEAGNRIQKSLPGSPRSRSLARPLWKLVV